MNDEMAREVRRKASAHIKTAIDLEAQDSVNDAIKEWEHAILLLASVNENHEKHAEIQIRLASYKKRLAELKQKCLAENPHEERRIKEGSVGHGYDKIFGQCCDRKLTSVSVCDSYVRNKGQVVNFVKFCELVVSLSPRLETITLITDPKSNKNQSSFDSLQESLLALKNIKLEVKYEDNLHDREMRFDNGWIVRPGRGLDIYHPIPDEFHIGAYDLNMRQCRETTIDIIKPTGR